MGLVVKEAYPHAAMTPQYNSGRSPKIWVGYIYICILYKKLYRYIYIYIYTRAPHGCLPAPMLRIGKYTPAVPSRVITFEEVEINVPFDLVTNRIRARPSDAEKRYYLVSVLSFLIYLSHSNY